MLGPSFTTPLRLVSQSHGAVAWRFPSPIPSHVSFPFATSHPRPILSVLWIPYPTGLLYVPIPSLIPCLYPTGQPATLLRGPTGSSSIRGPFRVPSTGRSLPAPAPFPCAVSHHSFWPIPRHRTFPFTCGCCVALATRPSLSRPFFPSSRVYTPPGLQQIFGAGPLEPLPSGDLFVCLALVAPFLFPLCPDGSARQQNHAFWPRQARSCQGFRSPMT